jgi:hypothetical protein
MREETFHGSANCVPPETIFLPLLLLPLCCCRNL